jgi:hypothetical protein
MTVLEILRQKALEYGIPFEVVYSIVGVETGGTFDTKTIGDNGQSYGLFQIHKPAHPSFDTSRYTDVKYQADYQLPELKRFYDLGYSKGYRGAELAKYVEVYGQRPAYEQSDVKNYIDSSIPKYYTQVSTGNTESAEKMIQDSFDRMGLPTYMDLGELLDGKIGPSVKTFIYYTILTIILIISIKKIFE